MNPKAIPAELRELSQWVAWGSGKVPYQPGSASRASSKSPDTWGSFEQACADVVAGRCAGIGFVFAAGGSIVGVDFDHCLDGEQLDPWVADWVDRFDSYTEISPSGTGLHIFCLGQLPGKGVKKSQAEMYDQGRYFTVTGDCCGPSRPLRAAQETIEALYAELTARRAAGAPTMAERKPVDLTDDELLEKAMRAKGGEEVLALWEGELTDYPSQSEADQALCNRLAFWTNGDPERIDCLFRQSALMREKWDRPTGDSTYGQLTIESAIRSMQKGYDPEEYHRQEAIRDFTPQAKELNVISAPELMKADLGETQFIVVDLLPQGLSLLASPPKYGKSWFVLDLCIAVARGTRFLGHETHPCGCLYMALEDSQNRLKSRMEKLLGGAPTPRNLSFVTVAPDLSNGLIDMLEQYLRQYPDTGLIAIDTLQRIRGQMPRNESAYNYDYREIGDLKAFADRRGILVLLVHHLRKMGDDTDPHNRISGTNGIMGAVDTSLVITKAKRSDDTATLSVTGRDVESSETVLEFDKGACKWKPLGSLEEVSEQEARREYQESPLIRTIETLIERGGGIWRGTMSDLMEAGREIAGVNLAATNRALSTMVNKMGGPMFDYDGIVHTRAKNGSGGGKHSFYKYTVDAHTDA